MTYIAATCRLLRKGYAPQIVCPPLMSTGAEISREVTIWVVAEKTISDRVPTPLETYRAIVDGPLKLHNRPPNRMELNHSLTTEIRGILPKAGRLDHRLVLFEEPFYLQELIMPPRFRILAP